MDIANVCLELSRIKGMHNLRAQPVARYEFLEVGAWASAVWLFKSQFDSLVMPCDIEVENPFTFECAGCRVELHFMKDIATPTPRTPAKFILRMEELRLE